MQDWMANGAALGWLVDPYARQVIVSRKGEVPVIVDGKFCKWPRTCLRCGRVTGTEFLGKNADMIAIHPSSLAAIGMLSLQYRNEFLHISLAHWCFIRTSAVGLSKRLCLFVT